MKSAIPLGSATRTVGKLFFALTLLVVAVAAGFGGTALIVYRSLDSGHAQASRNVAERKAVNPSPDKSSAAKKDEGVRPVAASHSDQPSYTYADNNGGQPSTPARRVRPGASVPAPLEDTAPAASVPNPSIGLNDPESQYIVDSRTGRVVGIDGSAGARREEEKRLLDAAPRAVAVQTPPPEVRVASAVVEDGQGVIPAASGTQYLSVRRALPVTADAANAGPRNFNVAEYMAGGQARPVMRAQPVSAKAVRVFRLSDGSQIVAAD